MVQLLHGVEIGKRVQYPKNKFDLFLSKSEMKLVVSLQAVIRGWLVRRRSRKGVEDVVEKEDNEIASSKLEDSGGSSSEGEEEEKEEKQDSKETKEDNSSAQNKNELNNFEKEVLFAKNNLDMFSNKEKLKLYGLYVDVGSRERRALILYSVLYTHSPTHTHPHTHTHSTPQVQASHSGT